MITRIIEYIEYIWIHGLQEALRLFYRRYNTYLFLLFAVIIAFLSVIRIRKVMKISVWKTLVMTVSIGISGFLGSKIWAFIESGKDFSGMSLFGGVLLLPLFMIPMVFIVRLSYSTIMDFASPIGALLLAVMKVHCCIVGCCGGRILYTNAAGEPVRFPSQLTEAVVNFLLFAYVLYCLNHGKFKGRLYPFALFLYGCLRFPLNLLRETEPFLWILPAGNVWSIVSILAGTVWLIVTRPKKKIQAEE